MVPVPFWLYYFNIDDIDAAAKRVKAGSGQILNGPIEVPGGSWIVQCTDPQGAMFALVGRRSYKLIGFFERSARPQLGGGCRGSQRVGFAHVSDQITDFCADLGSSRTARSPPPIEPEALAMPLDKKQGRRESSSIL